jgi:hypothetical protein
MISRAAARTKYFVPILRPEGAAGLQRAQGLMIAELPHVPASGDIAISLAARATLRVNDGDLDGAWSDILTLLRLARLNGQGPNVVEAVVGQAISQLAQNAAQVYLEFGHPSGDAARRNLQDLTSLSPLQAMADKVHVSERMMFVDAVLLMQDPDDDAGRILAEMSTAEGREGLKILRQSLEKAGHPPIDWDAALAAGHAWYDRAVGALRKPTYREQVAAADELGRSMDGSLAKVIEGGRQQFETGQRWWSANDSGVGEVLAGVMMSDVSLLPKARGLIEQRARNLRVALAVVAFADAEGGFPETLEQLAPEYLDRVPEDYFSQAPLKYREKLVGRVVYSVGPNVRDEGGVHSDSGGADDEVVTIPH